MEGDDCFDDPFHEGDPDADPECDLDAYTHPVATIFHDPALEEGHRAVIGGYVYRGACYPDIEGWYFYADHRTARVWKFVYADGEATEHTEVTVDLDEQDVLNYPASFGEDSRGELYIAARRDGIIYRVRVKGE